jgi:hypothetical protein
MNKKHTWPCGCILITEPYSNYRWFPCAEHSAMDIVNVLCNILKEEDVIIQDLEDIELTISYI